MEVRRMGRAEVAAALLLTALVGGCDSGTGPGSDLSFDFDFAEDAHAFEADFTDVAVEQAEDVDFEAGHRPLPEPLAGGGLFHSGLNLSDDLFMFFRRRVEGLEPTRRYAVRFRLEIASDVHEGCEIGVGTLVTVKAGASRTRPERVVVDMHGRDEYRLSVDKGEQSNSGKAALALDDVRNGLPGCPSPGSWDREPVDGGDREIEVVADQDGAIWLFFGTESAFEVPHGLFFTRFRAELVPR